MCMCVVSKQFELLDVVFDSCNMIRFLSLLLLSLCPCVASIIMWSSLVCL